MIHPRALLSATAVTLCAACVGTGSQRSLEWWEAHPPLPSIDTSWSEDGVVPLPEEAHPALREVFGKYTRLVAPSGRPIHFLAQPGVPDEQLIRARELMRFLLTDAPGTRYGGDKSAVANEMADRWATLVYFQTQEDSLRAQGGELPRIPLFYQDLYVEETVVEGSEAYLRNQLRDGTLEAVFHLVHGAGIRFALPEYHQAIVEAARDAVRGDRWRTSLDWVLEGSNAHQYVTSVLDVYFGIWAHDPHGSGRSFGGEYDFIDRAGLEAGDPRGVELLEMFLPRNLDFDCRVSPGFEGVFSLVHSPGTPYTLKSRYLSNVRLSGAAGSGLLGNERDNQLGGNAGDNWIDGGAGHDAVLFSGKREEYEVAAGEGGVVVADAREGRDGRDVLTEVECLHFSDGALPLSGECAHRTSKLLEEALQPGNGARPWARFEFDLERHVEAVLDELLACFDRDGDGALGASEATDDFQTLVELADRDGDGAGSRSELARAVRSVLLGEVQLSLDPMREVERFFARFDLDRDGRVLPTELPRALLQGFDEADANGDGAITPEELLPSYSARD